MNLAYLYIHCISTADQHLASVPILPRAPIIRGALIHRHLRRPACRRLAPRQTRRLNRYVYPRPLTTRAGRDPAHCRSPDDVDVQRFAPRRSSLASVGSGHAFLPQTREACRFPSGRMSANTPRPRADDRLTGRGSSHACRQHSSTLGAGQSIRPRGVTVPGPLCRMEACEEGRCETGMRGSQGRRVERSRAQRRSAAGRDPPWGAWGLGIRNLPGG